MLRRSEDPPVKHAQKHTTSVPVEMMSHTIDEKRLQLNDLFDCQRPRLLLRLGV